MTLSSVKPFTSLAQWLKYCEQIHPQKIELGLDRVQKVRQFLGMAFKCPVIVVAGTNGKGSTCAMLESILMASGYQTGVYSSPHLLHFEERCRINRKPVQAQSLLACFAAVEKARQQADVTLTYFEFTTLALLYFMSQQALGVAILEIGLGGRFDAVNIIDNDCAIITNVDIDHTEYLGPDRESIGYEKAGVMRTGKPVVVNEHEPPQSVLNEVRLSGAQLFLAGRDYHYCDVQGHWVWEGAKTAYLQLPYPALSGVNQLGNAAGVLAVLESLKGTITVSEANIAQGLQTVQLPGRFQTIQEHPTIILDVAHNPHAARALADNLQQMKSYTRTKAVFGAMHDKDIKAVLEIMRGLIDEWFFTDLPTPRALPAKKLATLYQEVCGIGAPVVHGATFQTPELALQAALKTAQPTDRIIVFGSFYTVGGVMAARLPQSGVPQ